MSRVRSVAPAGTCLIRRASLDVVANVGAVGEERPDAFAKVVDRLDIQRALDAVRPADRAIVELLFRYQSPLGYSGGWPATADDVRQYLGATFPEFRGRAPAAQTVWRRYRAVLEMWAEQRSGVVTRKAA